MTLRTFLGIFLQIYIKIMFVEAGSVVIPNYPVKAQISASLMKLNI